MHINYIIIITYGNNFKICMKSYRTRRTPYIVICKLYDKCIKYRSTYNNNNNNMTYYSDELCAIRRFIIVPMKLKVKRNNSFGSI